MENENSPRVQLAEAIATVREFVVHASALAGMGAEPTLPCELEPLAREIIVMLNRTPQDAERSTAVPRDGASTEDRSDTTIISETTTGSKSLSVGEPTVRPLGKDPLARRKTLREAVFDVIKEGEVVSVPQVVQRLSETGVPATPSTASNELSRWTKLGHLDRPRRGHYQRVQTPKDQEVQPPTTNHVFDFGARKGRPLSPSVSHA